MKILFAASECVPFIKTGGLADVVGALSPVLKAQGADVRVILPLYAAIPEQYVSQMKLECEFEVELCWRRQYCGIKSLEYQGVTFYFVDNQYYFGRSYIYGLGGDEYERFGFFDRAVIDALVHLDFKPDVIHCHDWQTGMIPALLKIQYAQFPFYQDMKTVYTIHNLQYQGVFPIKAVQDTLGLGDSLFTSDKLECYGCANYMKAGLVYADELTTVSPSYADEIQTAFYGERLDGLLRARKDQLVGILKKRVDVVHVVADGASTRRLVLGALLLEGLVIGDLLLGHRALRFALAEIAGVAAGHVERGHGRQVHLVFRALLDAAFEQKVRKRAASPLNARRADDDQAFHSQFLSVAAVCTCSICQGVGGRSNNVRAFCAI